MEFLNFLPQLYGTQTCCTSTKEPCGNPTCEIRICAKNNGYRTCAECTIYSTCSKLDFLKPHHATLLSDLDFIKKKGVDKYVEEIIAKYKLKPVTISWVIIPPADFFNRIFRISFFTQKSFEGRRFFHTAPLLHVLRLPIKELSICCRHSTATESHRSWDNSKRKDIPTNSTLTGCRNEEMRVLRGLTFSTA